MKTRLNIPALILLLGLMILSACGSKAQAPEAPAMAEPLLAQDQAPGVESMGEAEAAKGAPAPSSDVSPIVVNNTGANTSQSELTFSHMIIKNGEIKLLVEDTDIAIDRTTQAIGDMGGYIVSSRVWYQAYYDGENYNSWFGHF